ncbi:plasmid mobilization protein [Thioclava electrotropha]|uniref:Mobilization protein n=1 Tax=Thioclava electrotropha TaxID=1549850 RepID=A0ABX6YTK6_9RHOB|nr:hypothetical protein [Thioclava electrotropha]QPZ91058.1 hypothetical protein AKL02_009165 [Thioclava electrotropha]
MKDTEVECEVTDKRKRREIRATDAEWAGIKNAASAADLSISDYVCRCALATGNLPRSKKSPAILIRIEWALCELNEILRGIARELVSTGKIEPKALNVLVQCEGMLIKVESALRKSGPVQ